MTDVISDSYENHKHVDDHPFKLPVKFV